MGAYLAISILTISIFHFLKITTSVIIDNLDLECVTTPKHETDTVLIVNPYAPLTSAVTLELLKPITRRHFQKLYLGRRIN